MSSGLYSGVSGLALGVGLSRDVSGLWSGSPGFARGGGVDGFTLYAIPLIDTTGTTGVVSQLYTNLTGTLVFSKLSGDAAATVSSTGAISTSVALHLGDTLSMVAKVEDTTSGTYIEAPITIEGSVPGAYAYESWAGPGWFDFSDAATLTLTGSNIDAVANKRAGGGDLTYGGTANGITTVAAVQNGRAVARLVRDVSSNTSARRLVASSAATVSTMFVGNDLPYTIISVFIPKDANPGFVWGASHWVSSTSHAQVTQVRRTTPNCTVRKGAYPNLTVADVNFGSGEAADAPRVTAIKHTGTAVSVWDNSTTAIVSAAAQDTPAIAVPLVFCLGAVQANGSAGPWGTFQCNTDYCEIVVESSAKSDADIQQAITDLAAKWGITLS